MREFPFFPHGVPLEDAMFFANGHLVLWKTTGEIEAVERIVECREEKKNNQHSARRRMA